MTVPASGQRLQTAGWPLFNFCALTSIVATSVGLVACCSGESRPRLPAAAATAVTRLQLGSQGVLRRVHGTEGLPGSPRASWKGLCCRRAGGARAMITSNSAMLAMCREACKRKSPMLATLEPNVRLPLACVSNAAITSRSCVPVCHDAAFSGQSVAAGGRPLPSQPGVAAQAAAAGHSRICASSASNL